MSKYKDNKLRHLDTLLINYLKNRNISISGWQLGYQYISSELVWKKDNCEIFSTPFWEDDSKWIIIVSNNDKFETIEELDVWRDSYDIKSGNLSFYKFVEHYLNTMREKILCIEQQKK